MKLSRQLYLTLKYYWKPHSTQSHSPMTPFFLFSVKQTNHEPLDETLDKETVANITTPATTRECPNLRLDRGHKSSRVYHRWLSGWENATSTGVSTNCTNLWTVQHLPKRASDPLIHSLSHSGGLGPDVSDTDSMRGLHLVTKNNFSGVKARLGVKPREDVHGLMTINQPVHQMLRSRITNL